MNGLWKRRAILEQEVREFIIAVMVEVVYKAQQGAWSGDASATPAFRVYLGLTARPTKPDLSLAKPRLSVVPTPYIIDKIIVLALLFLNKYLLSQFIYIVLLEI